MGRILIINDGHDAGASYAPLFAKLGETTKDIAAFKLNPSQFKLVVFTGGPDVSPSMYGDASPKNLCYCDPERDKQEAALFNFARAYGVKMTGICRGMQFLNVMAGGKLMHHINGHDSSDHLISVPKMPWMSMVNSLHHQMCIPHIETQVIAWAPDKLSDKYIGGQDEEIVWLEPEVEGIFNSKFNLLAVQWHPEAQPEGALGKRHYLNLVESFLSSSSIEFQSCYMSHIKTNVVGANG